MGAEDIKNNSLTPVTLVIFTCEAREHLVYATYNSFTSHCKYQFSKTILAIDGKINTEVVDHIKPDTVILSPGRKGYVNNIIRVLPAIDTEYFFWLEDDWKFHEQFDLDYYLNIICQHPDWVEIFFSKFGPLPTPMKEFPLGNNLYKTSFGFSANPGICRTKHIRSAFTELVHAPKGEKLGEDGFENFLSKVFERDHNVCTIVDPVDHTAISHEGYLESSSRKWHMTNSVDNKIGVHQMVIPKPSLSRKLVMYFKLIGVFFRLSYKQLVNDETYEFCFRIISSVKSLP